jgi:hypothetical protein
VRTSGPRRLVAALVALALVAAVAVAAVLLVRRLTGSPQDRYCTEVQDRRAELSDTLSRDSPDVLLLALPVFEDLAARAPSDIRDEWQQVVSAITGLADALDAAGVDPATYDRKKPPTGVSAAERTRIDDAAVQVGSQATAGALGDLDQQARDVCGTPLTQ